jgi:hypothetical protein
MPFPSAMAPSALNWTPMTFLSPMTLPRPMPMDSATSRTSLPMQGLAISYAVNPSSFCANMA